MPESTTAATAPATGASGEPATGKEPAPAAATAATTPATGGPTTPTAAAPAEPELTPDEIRELVASHARMEEALKKANGEAEKRRREAAEAERAKMTAEEAANAELKELREQSEAWKVEKAEYLIEREVTRLAPTLGLVDPEAVTKLLDWDTIEFDDKGKALNVKSQVEALIKDKPYLAGKPQAQPPRSAGNNAGDGTSGGPKPELSASELEAAQAAKMTPERYAALRDLNRSGAPGVRLSDWQATRRTPAGGAQ